MDLKSYMMIEGNLSNEFNKSDDYIKNGMCLS